MWAEKEGRGCVSGQVNEVETRTPPRVPGSASYPARTAHHRRKTHETRKRSSWCL
jgi:hypothetical protein